MTARAGFFPAGVIEAVRAHPAYAMRRRNADDAWANVEAAKIALALTNTGDAYAVVVGALDTFKGAQARVSELYAEAFARHRGEAP